MWGRWYFPTNGLNNISICFSRNLPLPHPEVDSIFPPLETGWDFVTASINRMQWKWCVTSETGLEKPTYLLAISLSWDSHPWDWTTILWGSPSYPGKVPDILVNKSTEHSSTWLSGHHHPLRFHHVIEINQSCCTLSKFLTHRTHRMHEHNMWLFHVTEFGVIYYTAIDDYNNQAGE